MTHLRAASQTTEPARLPAQAQTDSARLTPLDVWAFVLPAISFIEVTVVGRLIVTEVLMLVMLPWLWSARDRLPLPRWFVVLWAGWLVGQILTDLVVGSAFEDYARGWAAIALTMTNFAAIVVLVSTPRRARLFALGLASGGILGYVLVPTVYAAFDPWKWAIALPAGLIITAGLSGSMGARRPWLVVAVIGAFGLLNLYLGFRSLGGVSLLAAGYLALSAILVRRSPVPASSALRSGAVIAVLVVAAVGVLQLYDAAASSGILGEAAQTTYQEQSRALGTLVGGRSEVLVSSQAIVDSPILGHGSWARDFAYVDLLADRLSSLGYEVGADASDVGLIPAHSYLLGSWVWAGVLGGLFWAGVGAAAIWLLMNLYALRLEIAPLLAFSTILLLWNVAFSPYGFNGRIIAPYGLALCLLGLDLLAAQRKTSEAITEPGPKAEMQGRSSEVYRADTAHTGSPTAS